MSFLKDIECIPDSGIEADPRTSRDLGAGNKLLAWLLVPQESRLTIPRFRKGPARAGPSGRSEHKFNMAESLVFDRHTEKG